MPYIKKTEPYAKMQRLLRGYGLNAPVLAKVLGCGETKARGLLKDAARLTLQDLDRINRFGHIPMEEIREAIERR